MYVRVTVYPDAKKEVVKSEGSERFEIRVKEPAERNLANRRVCELMAGVYAVSVRQVRIISGHQSSRKIISVPDTEVL